MDKKNYKKLFLLNLVLFFSFFRINILQFFIFFELRLIPIFFIIFQFGKQYERMYAAYRMFFFTFSFSLPFIMVLLIKFDYIWWWKENYYLSELNSFFFIFIYIVFLVKLPIYFLHSWLPLAHVEAPVYGSIILARIMLKLGGFGLIKIYFYFFIFLKLIEKFIASILIIGFIIAAFNCIFITDLKKIVAISSVSHMTFITMGSIYLIKISFSACLLIMISHGFSSSLFFYLVNRIYKRVNSRRVLVSKCNKLSFFLMNLLFIICLINFSVPPSLNFFREIILSFPITVYCKSLFIFLFVYIFISTLYSINLSLIINDHQIQFFFNRFSLSLKEFNIVVLHLNLIFFFPLLIYLIE